ncbi:MAG: formate acetyltransferase [Firmicutes bacterium]|nr:formate acetyltransferase [Bacillota bacterium]
MGKRWTYRKRLEVLKETKSLHTKIKRKIEGDRDTDDWGQIPAPDFIFKPETDLPEGRIMGPLCCAKNFRKLLGQMPVYVNKYSSMLGGYTDVFFKYVTQWDPEEYWTELAPAQKKYNIICGIGNSHHFSVDYKIGFRYGFKGLLQKIRHYRALNSSPVTPDFYDALEEVVLGIQEWISRHINEARRMMEFEEDSELKQFLCEQIEVNERILNDPPQTFREACQWIVWYQMAARCYNGSGALGSIDQLLLPFYTKDKKSGILTDEEAIFHIACLNLTDPQYMQIGGLDKHGRDATNPLSFLVLEAIHRLKLTANLAVGVHDQLNEELFDNAVKMLFEDRNGNPRFFSATNIINDYAKNGIPMDDCLELSQTGCHWFSIPGKEYSFCDVIKVNFAAILNVAFNEMMADTNANPSLDKLWLKFVEHLKTAIYVVARGIDIHMENKHRFFPELVLDLLCYDTLEKGEDASHGALKYNFICVDGAALATAADSFAAIETRIENEKRISFKELKFLLDTNFVGNESKRMMMMNVPGYGRGNTCGDKWAVKIVNIFCETVREKSTPNGWNMIPGLFSWASTIPMGKEVDATPNGRKAKEPISFGANPDPGEMKGGGLNPISISQAVAMVQPGYGNTAPLQLDVDPGILYDGHDGLSKFKELIRGHFKQGGTLINVNVLDKKQIEEAYLDKEKYPDLIVRVTGFSAYFASLSDEFRKLVYNRIVSMDE